MVKVFLSVQSLRFFFKGTNHLANGFREKSGNQSLQDRVFEFKIDIEINRAAAIFLGQEAPVVREVTHRALDIFDMDVVGAEGCDFRREFFAGHFIADDKISIENIPFPARYPAGQAPGQEARIFINPGDQIKKLLRRVG